MASEGLNNQWKIRASVPTGLEIAADEECTEVLGKKPSTSRGCIELTISSLDQLHLVDSLRSVDNFYVVITEIRDFCVDKSSVLQRLEALPSSSGNITWLNALRAWRFYNENVMKKRRRRLQEIVTNNRDIPIGAHDQDDCSVQSKRMKFEAQPEQNTTFKEHSPRNDPSIDDQAPKSNAHDSQVSLESCPRPQNSSSSVCSDSSLLSIITSEFQGHSFRVTGTRTGPKTCYYSSMDVARVLGSGVVASFNWTVDLKNPDIEILLNLNEEGMVAGVALTREAKYKRNIVHFGPTTLRATIAYGLLRLGHPKAGDVVLDPLCGGGSISIEGFHGYPKTFHLCGDIHDLACKKSRDNAVAAAGTNEVGVAKTASGRESGVKMDVVRWDITNLPLRMASVDLVVTDMPFGKKMGSKAGNWDLYKRGLGECGRVCVPGSGRGVFMTHDTKAIVAAIKTSSLWQRYRTYWINLGGLKTGVHVLLRTKLKI